QNQFECQCCESSRSVEPVGQMLHVPADPCGQRTVLIILIHSLEVTPLRVSAGDLRHPGFEVDAKPLPLQKEQTGTGWRRRNAEAGAQSSRSKEDCDESRLKQHSIGLVTRKILRCAHER